jgi:hypothetical protein
MLHGTESNIAIEYIRELNREYEIIFGRNLGPGVSD